eukprot:58847_1
MALAESKTEVNRSTFTELIQERWDILKQITNIQRDVSKKPIKAADLWNLMTDKSELSWKHFVIELDKKNIKISNDLSTHLYYHLLWIKYQTDKKKAVYAVKTENVPIIEVESLSMNKTDFTKKDQFIKKKTIFYKHIGRMNAFCNKNIKVKYTTATEDLKSNHVTYLSVIFSKIFQALVDQTGINVDDDFINAKLTDEILQNPDKILSILNINNVNFFDCIPSQRTPNFKFIHTQRIEAMEYLSKHKIIQDFMQNANAKWIEQLIAGWLYQCYDSRSAVCLYACESLQKILLEIFSSSRIVFKDLINCIHKFIKEIINGFTKSFNRFGRDSLYANRVHNSFVQTMDTIAMFINQSQREDTLIEIVKELALNSDSNNKDIKLSPKQRSSLQVVLGFVIYGSLNASDVKRIHLENKQIENKEIENKEAENEKVKDVKMSIIHMNATAARCNLFLNKSFLQVIGKCLTNG